MSPSTLFYLRTTIVLSILIIVSPFSDTWADEFPIPNSQVSEFFPGQHFTAAPPGGLQFDCEQNGYLPPIWEIPSLIDGGTTNIITALLTRMYSDDFSIRQGATEQLAVIIDSWGPSNQPEYYARIAEVLSAAEELPLWCALTQSDRLELRTRLSRVIFENADRIYSTEATKLDVLITRCLRSVDASDLFTASNGQSALSANWELRTRALASHFGTMQKLGCTLMSTAVSAGILVYDESIVPGGGIVAVSDKKILEVWCASRVSCM